MLRNPYQGRPDYQFWKRAGGIDDPASFDPVTRTSFAISTTDAVVTAGSCFAQHVARHLRIANFNVLTTEQAHPLIPDKLASAFHYGVFAARYGNVYTARQLRQLLERAYGLFAPRTSAWRLKADRWVDPFRPQIQPGGYISVQELEMDRDIHLAAVREAVEGLDVFVFTLGLTEAWVDRADGAVYPLAPGVAGGEYDPSRITFMNYSARQTNEDLEWSLNFIRGKNPKVRIILTVSPVPLNATALDRHVAVSTAYSKAALRVAAEEAALNQAMVDYFPSFEIITSPQTSSRYYADDRRSITEDGVSHVMRVFLNHYSGIDSTSEIECLATSDSADELLLDRNSKSRSDSTNKRRIALEVVQEMQQLVEVLCDEEAIDS